jgi:hypothetical protein
MTVYPKKWKNQPGRMMAVKGSREVGKGKGITVWQD